MGKTRYLLGSINVINILLAGILIAVAYFTVFPGPSVGAGKRRPAVEKTTRDQKPAEPKKTTVEDKSPFPTDYIVIAEENLFHPDRKIPEEKADQKKADNLPKPEFVLDGTLITDGTKIAFMEDKKKPVNTPGRPNRQTPLKLGESMSGYTLVEIDSDKVVMKKGDDEIVVNLTSPSKAREYASTASSAAPVAGQQASSGNRPGTVNRERAQVVPRRFERRESQSNVRPSVQSPRQTAPTAGNSMYRGLTPGGGGGFIRRR